MEEFRQLNTHARIPQFQEKNVDGFISLVNYAKSNLSRSHNEMFEHVGESKQPWVRSMWITAT